MKTSYKYIAMTCLFMNLIVGSIYADDYSQNFDSWTTRTTVGDYSEEEWTTTNVLVRGAAGLPFGFFNGESDFLACWLFNETYASICTPFLTNTVGEITFSHRSKTLSSPQVVVIEGAFSFSGPYVEYGRATNPSSTTAWTPSSIPVNSFSNIYVRIRKNDDGGENEQYLAVDNISISTIPDLVEFVNTSNNPAAPLVNEDTTVFTTVSPLDNGVSNITTTIFYKTNASAPYISANMNTNNNTNFTFTISGQPSPASVLYYFETTFEINGQRSRPMLYPSASSNAPLSYSHFLAMGDDRLENFDDWGNLPALGTYTNASWIAGDAYVRGAAGLPFGFANGVSPPNSAWLDDLYDTSDPYVRSPLLDGIGTIYFANRPKLINSIDQVLAIETATSDSGPWTVSGYITNNCVSADWSTNFLPVNLFGNRYVRAHKIEDGSQDNQYLAIDNVVISHPPADVIITNVAHALGYMYITNEVTITCEVFTVSATIPAGNLQPKICYRFSSSNPWTTNDMTNASGSIYSGTIPASGAKGQVDYFIRCDFSGYYYEGAGYSEKQSPAFSPDAPASQATPDTYHSYIVRPYRSDFDYLSVTSTAGNVIMTLDDDYTWQGLIDMTINTQANLTFGILGFGYYTDSPPEYSLLTNHWGDTSHSNNATIPDNGVAEETTTPITIGGPFASPVVISLNTRNLDYLMVRGFYQDFDSWVSADSDFYERSSYGVGTTAVTNDYNTWSPSTDFVTTEASGLSAYFNTWAQPTAYAGLAASTVFWYTKDALLLPQRGASGIQKALILQPTSSGDAHIFPTLSTLDEVDGIGHISFKYRVSEFAEHYAVRDNESKDWQSVAIEFGCTFNGIEDDAKFSIIERYDDQTGYGYKAEIFHELGTAEKNDINFAYYRIDAGGTNKVYGGQGFDFDDDGSLSSYAQYGFLIATNSQNYKSFRLSKGGGNYGWHYSLSPGDNITNNKIAIEFSNCDVNIDWLKIRPVMTHVHANEVYGPIGDTNLWYKQMFSGDNMTNTESFIVSPFLPFTADRLQFYLDQDENVGGHTKGNVLIYGSDDRVHSNGVPTGARATLIFNDVLTGDRGTRTVSINVDYKYIWVCENHSPDPVRVRIDDLLIVGEPELDEDFTSPSHTNNWTFDAGGGWNLDTNSSALNYPGYAGPPVRIVVETTPLDTDYFPYAVPVWTEVYTNSVTNYNWSAITRIDLDSLDPFVEHAHPIGFRIRNDNRNTGEDSTGYLIIDNVDFSDWHGETIGDDTTWKATEARVETDGSDVYIELARDRAYKEIPDWGITNIQYIQSPPFTGGISSISFKFKVANAPASFGVFIAATNNMATDALWDPVPYSSFTVNNNSTTWSNKTVSIREEGSWAIRIVHTSATDKATLMITEVSVSDYSGENDSTWLGHNTLITGNQSPEFSTDDGTRTCYLNKDGSSQVKGGAISPTLAYLESPRSEPGIGSVSFWYRHFDDSGSPPGTLEFYVTTSRSTDINEWGSPIGTLTNITNTTYQYFSQSFYEKDFQFLKIVNGTNGVANGRVCIDNVLIKEPMGAALTLANITTIPSVPLYSTSVGIEVEVTKNIFNASNVTMRAYYKTGTNNWGAWATNSASGSFLMTNASGPDEVVGIYRTTNTFAPQNIDDIVQYYIVCNYEGDFHNSPQPYKGFSNPSWYEPIDLNAADPASTIPYYFTFSCTTGAVWINEYKIWDYDADDKTNQFVELCGQNTANIGNWELGVNDQWGGMIYSNLIKIPNGTILSRNETNGFAFYLFGDDTGVPTRDLSMGTNIISAFNQIVLYRSMGAYADISYDLDHPHNDWGDESMSLTGSLGSWAGNFVWTSLLNAYTPGSINSNQTFVSAFGANLSVGIEIIDAWVSGDETWVVYEITGTNHYLPPVPLYTTNIEDSGSWSNVTSSSYTSALPYPEWVNTYTSWWTTISAGAVYHKLSVTNIITP